MEFLLFKKKKSMVHGRKMCISWPKQKKLTFFWLNSVTNYCGHLKINSCFQIKNIIPNEVAFGLNVQSLDSTHIVYTESDVPIDHCQEIVPGFKRNGFKYAQKCDGILMVNGN